jgi:hypothetical protein
MAGKGSKQRPTDHSAYSSNYDAIFGRKAEVNPQPTSNPGYEPIKPANGPGLENYEKCQNCGSTVIDGQCLNKACKK